MKCPDCAKPLKAKKTKVDYSAESFQGVIIDAKEYTCKCGASLIVYPDDHQINKEICEYILRQDHVMRTQIQYIMYTLFGENVFQFAVRLKIPPQHLRDLINRKKILSTEISDSIIVQLFKHFKKVNVVFE